MDYAKTIDVTVPDSGDSSKLNSRLNPGVVETKPLLLSADGKRSYSSEDLNQEISSKKIALIDYIERSPKMTEEMLFGHLNSMFSDILLMPIQSIELRSERNYIFVSFIQNIINMLRSGIPSQPLIEGGLNQQDDIDSLERETLSQLTKLWGREEITEEEYKTDFKIIALIIRSYRHASVSSVAA